MNLVNYAHDLTILFADESDIPSRFKSINNKQKTKKDSIIEKRYQKHLSSWLSLFDVLHDSCKNEELFYRIISVNPLIQPGTSSFTKCQDYVDLTLILIQRRDINQCGPDELGRLSFLHTIFQNKIESTINKQE